MKQFIFIFMVMTALSAVGQHPVLEIGAKMPSCDENMQCATSGKTFQLDDLKGENGLFLGCPMMAQL